MKLKKTLRTAALAAMSSVLVLAMLTACGQEAASESSSSSVDEGETVYSSDNVADSETPEESTAVSSEATQQKGATLETCKQVGGIFMAMDDGTFVKYNPFRGTVDKENYTYMSEAIWYDSTMEQPVDKLCFFMFPGYEESNFGMSLYPVETSNFYPSVIVPGRDEPWPVTAILWNGSSDDDHVIFNLEKGGEFENMRIDTIDGVKAGASIPFQQVTESFLWYAFPKEYEHETITIGYTSGTTLREQECEVDYYLGKYGKYISEDEYDITATTDGYAVLDFHDVPDGLYVMVVSISGGGQYAMLVNIQH